MLPPSHALAREWSLLRKPENALFRAGQRVLSPRKPENAPPRWPGNAPPRKPDNALPRRLDNALSAQVASVRLLPKALHNIVFSSLGFGKSFVDDLVETEYHKCLE